MQKSHNIHTYLFTFSLYRQVHKAERRARHPVWSLAFSFKSIPELLSVRMSCCTVLLRVVLGCPHFLFPAGACDDILSTSILRACPWYCHLLLLIVLDLHRQLFSRTTSFEIYLFHRMLNILLRHFWWNEASFFSILAVRLQHSAPYKRTESTLVW